MNLNEARLAELGNLLIHEISRKIVVVALGLSLASLVISCNQISLFKKELDHKGVKYLVESRAGLEHYILRVEHRGSLSKNSILERDIDRKIYAAEISDLDMNGVPEIYIYGKSNDSDEYGDVFCFTLGDDGALTQIFVPTLDPYISKGYMGHDQFSVSDIFLNRKFRVSSEVSVEEIQKVKYALTKSNAGLFLNEVNDGPKL